MRVPKPDQKRILETIVSELLGFAPARCVQWFWECGVLHPGNWRVSVWVVSCVCMG